MKPSLLAADAIVLAIRSLAPLSFLACLVFPILTLSPLGLELVWTFYHLLLIRRVSSIHPPPTSLPHSWLRAFVLRAMGSGMKHPLIRKNGFLEDHSPESLAPISAPLERDDPRAVDFRTRQMNHWFSCRVWTDVGREDVVEWLCWALFCQTPDEVLESDREASMRGGGESKMEVVDWAVPIIAHRAGFDSFPDGKGVGVATHRVSFDPVRILHRPLAMYLFVGGTSWTVEKLMRIRGFEKVRSGKLEVLMRVPKGWRAGRDPRPLIFIHGLGIGLAQYACLLHHLAASEYASCRPVVIPVQPNTSLALFDPGHLSPPTFASWTRDLGSLLDRFGLAEGGVEVLGHSWGTVMCGWIVKAFPDLVKRLALVDPVCFALWDPYIGRNFLYNPPTTFLDTLARYLVGTEIGVVATLQKGMTWSTDLLWPEEIPGFSSPSSFACFLSGKDTILDVDRLRRYLVDSGMKDADTPVFDESVGHWRTVEGDARGRGGLAIGWDEIHGTGLVWPGKVFKRITGWLKDGTKGVPAY